MTPATSQNLAKFRKQVGEAIYLLLLLADFTPPAWDGQTPTWVAGGNIVSDIELSARLGVSQKAISTWRSKLRATGVIGWLVSPGNGRAYWVGGVNAALAAAQRSDTKRISTAAVVWRAIQERSIALTGKVVEDLNPDEGLRLADALARCSKNPGESERE